MSQRQLMITDRQVARCGTRLTDQRYNIFYTATPHETCSYLQGCIPRRLIVCNTKVFGRKRDRQKDTQHICIKHLHTTKWKVRRQHFKCSTLNTFQSYLLALMYLCSTHKWVLLITNTSVAVKDHPHKLTTPTHTTFSIMTSKPVSRHFCGTSQSNLNRLCMLNLFWVLFVSFWFSKCTNLLLFVIIKK